MYEDVVQRAEEAQDLIQFLCARKEPDFVFPFLPPSLFSLPCFPLLPFLLLLKKKGHLALNFGKINCLHFIP